jgi:3-methyladenine DNA glycosylase AlkD
MTSEHRALCDQLLAAARPAGGFDLQKYAGSRSRMLHVPVPERRRIAKAWLSARKHWPVQQVLAVVDELVAGDIHDEKTLGLLLLERLGRGRRPFGPAEVDRWLDHLVGWAEVDSLCQSTFGPEDLLGDWPAWSGFIRRLARDANINRRRAALVLLVKPAGKSPDPRLAALAFETTEALKGEREIIITKAVSWLLRALTLQHPAEVSRYLDAEGPSLPAIAVRETRAKIATGRKTPRPRQAGT